MFDGLEIFLAARKTSAPWTRPRWGLPARRCLGGSTPREPFRGSAPGGNLLLVSLGRDDLVQFLQYILICYWRTIKWMIINILSIHIITLFLQRVVLDFKQRHFHIHVWISQYSNLNIPIFKFEYPNIQIWISWYSNLNMCANFCQHVMPWPKEITFLTDSFTRNRFHRFMEESPVLAIWDTSMSLPYSETSARSSSSALALLGMMRTFFMEGKLAMA